MTPASGLNVASAVEDARRGVLEAVLLEDHPAVLTDSPPGAGKTDLVEAVAATAVHRFDMRVAVVTPRVEQANDLVRRLRSDYMDMPITLLHATHREPPEDLLSDARVGTATNASGVPIGSGVTVTTAAKLAVTVPDLLPSEFSLLIADEAYQSPWKNMAPLMHVADRHLLIGDPGQLPPLVRGDIARLEAAPHKVHWAAPRELGRRNPRLRRLKLPATWRFPQDTVDFMQPAFYPDLVFASAAAPEDRRLAFGAAGGSGPIDEALNALADGASVVALLLPRVAVDVDQVDDAVAALAAAVVERILQRGAEWVGRGRLIEDDIGYADAHVASGERTRVHLRAAGIGAGTMTQTPEIWQGLQRPVMVTKHPLSGRSRLSAFDLEPGRFCVMTSRHQLANIIVGRDGVGEALERHHHDCAERPSGAPDNEWAGWRAQDRLWRSMEAAGRVFRI